MPNSFVRKRSIIEREAAAVQIVVTGSSHEYFGVDPAQFPCRAINIANAGQSLPFDFALVRANLARMKALQVLVLSISIFSLDYRMSTSPDAGRTPLYWHAFGLEIPEEPLPGWIQRSFLMAYGPRKSLLFTLGGFRGEAKEIDDRGWFPSADASEISAAAGRERAQYHLSIMHSRNRVGNLSGLVETTQDARAHGAKVVFLISPVLKTYVDGFPRSVLEDMRTVLATVSASNGAVVADYLEDARFSAADFADNDHLSPQGATRFSRFLGIEYLGHLATCSKQATPPSQGSPL